jgi:hypothetical protein
MRILPKHIYWEARTRKYFVSVFSNGALHHVGTFLTVEDAMTAANIARASKRPTMRTKPKSWAPEEIERLKKYCSSFAAINNGERMTSVQYDFLVSVFNVSRNVLIGKISRLRLSDQLWAPYKEDQGVDEGPPLRDHGLFAEAMKRAIAAGLERMPEPV